jgi:hypothetical protein
MWHATKWTTGALFALALTAAGCSDVTAAGNAGDPSMTAAGRDAGRVYDQVEFLGNPLVSEVTILKARHDEYNRTQPYNRAAFGPETERFIVEVGGRPAGYAATIAGVLYPDMLIVDGSKDPSTAGWLSWALANGYGGRKPADDVVDIGLAAIFSSLLSPEGASCAPFQLPLCTDNVGANDRAFAGTFPYLASPHI